MRSARQGTASPSRRHRICYEGDEREAPAARRPRRITTSIHHRADSEESSPAFAMGLFCSGTMGPDWRHRVLPAEGSWAVCGFLCSAPV